MEHDNIIRYINRRKKPFYARDIAKALNVNAGTVHNVIKRHFKGRIFYISVPEDAHLIFIFFPTHWTREDVKAFADARTKSGVSRAKIRVVGETE